MARQASRASGVVAAETLIGGAQEVATLSNFAMSVVDTLDPAASSKVTEVRANGSGVEARTVHGPGAAVPEAYSKYRIPADSRKRNHCMAVALYCGQPGVRLLSPEPWLTHAVSAPPPMKK